MLRAATLLTAASIAPLLAQGATWTLKNDLSGTVDKFLNGFNFVTTITNFENANYMSTAANATGKGLASTTADGTIILKVDDTTDGRGNNQFGRDSIQLYSKDTFNKGSLILIDAVHVPYGCSVWPSIWLLGDETNAPWPMHGEIDILEAVNERKANGYALHTLQGCTHPAAIDSATETGVLVGANCDSTNTTGTSSGCQITEPDSTNSAGAGLAANKGGVYAMLWDDDGIKTWFFQRSAIPQDLSTTSPDPSKWTQKPTAFWPQSSCDTSKFFTPQTLIVDIAICGAFASAPPVWAESCAASTGKALCTDVVGDPSYYKNAYFELNYIRTFTSSGSSSGSSTSATGSASASRSASSSAASATGSSAPSGAIKTQSLSPLWGLMTALPLLAVL
jgi:hypothetical protein